MNEILYCVAASIGKGNVLALLLIAKKKIIGISNHSRFVASGGFLIAQLLCYKTHQTLATLLPPKAAKNTSLAFSV